MSASIRLRLPAVVLSNSQRGGLIIPEDPMPEPSVLILTRGEQQEAEVKKLLPGRVRSVETEFWRATLENSINAAAQAGLRAIISSPLPIVGLVTSRQEGRTFFERLRNAESSARGADASLIIVAADVPQLSVQHLCLAAERIRGREKEVVLGPTDDGGIYLIASQAPTTPLLADVRWRTKHVAGDVTRLLRAAGFEIFWLPRLQDVDNSRDLHASIRHAVPALQKTYRLILSSLRSFIERIVEDLGLNEGNSSDVFDRGPPGTLAHSQFQ